MSRRQPSALANLGYIFYYCGFKVESLIVDSSAVSYTSLGMVERAWDKVGGLVSISKGLNSQALSILPNPVLPEIYPVDQPSRANEHFLLSTRDETLRCCPWSKAMRSVPNIR